jgi:hypothetical protein
MYTTSTQKPLGIQLQTIQEQATNISILAPQHSDWEALASLGMQHQNKDEL